MKVNGYDIPRKLYYNREHQWAVIDDDGNAKIGITDYAQKMLKEITFVYLPSKGVSLNIGDVLCVIESIKARIDTYVPLTGEILEVNEELDKNPFIINEDPYGDGWIVTIRPSMSETELQRLINARQYAEYVKGLIRRDKDLLIHKWKRR